MKVSEVDYGFPRQVKFAFSTLVFVGFGIFAFYKLSLPKWAWWLYGIAGVLLVSCDVFVMTPGGGDMWGPKYKGYYANLRTYLSNIGKPAPTLSPGLMDKQLEKINKGNLLDLSAKQCLVPPCN